MINTRISIFKSLKTVLRELTKHGDMNPKGFKDILYAVILNDMREWSLYIPNSDHKKIDKILSDFILSHEDLQIERFIDNPNLYKNVNTPLDNTTWRRIWDNKDYQKGDITDHAKIFGSPTFRLQGTTLAFYPRSETTYSDNKLNTNLHDLTLFEYGRKKGI